MISDLQIYAKQFWDGLTNLSAGAITGGGSAYVLFFKMPETIDAIAILLKIIGVVCFAGLGAAVQFFVKRYLEKKYPK